LSPQDAGLYDNTIIVCVSRPTAAAALAWKTFH
jgi:hypothetical protein